MSDWYDGEVAGEGEAVDPRLEKFILYHPGENGRNAVFLVGVAHDHPSSVARVAHLLDAVAPDVLALELPPLAIPLFRLYAADEYVPPRLGGEMSTAIQRAGDARIVGIDGPNAAYIKLLVRRVIADRVSVSDVSDIVGDSLKGVGHALACRFGASIGRLTSCVPKLYTHIAYDSASFDTPSAQARHEQSHVTERQSFLRVVELPRATSLIDAVREESMAVRLTELRSTGDVVAVVGIEHLEELSEQLGNTARSTGGADPIGSP
ncbi:hypothetical protein [Halorubrum sp. HHNYT27]|uniref:hypothetical protein n=1 Tax=Halorubrum sp. HHNYT27 TaxID=3402275 RepID=UPI003EC130B6